MRQCRVVDQSTLPYRGTKLQRYFQNLTLKERQQNLKDKKKSWKSADETYKSFKRHDNKGMDLVAGVTIMCEGISM